MIGHRKIITKPPPAPRPLILFVRPFDKPYRELTNELQHRNNMTDVRSMLRSERVARRLTHPHLAYSTTNTLVCTVCHIQLKSEPLWIKHLESSQHTMRIQSIRDNASGTPHRVPPHVERADGRAVDSTNGGKKRKADAMNGDVRKKSKAANGLSTDLPDDEALYQALSSDSESRADAQVHLQQLTESLPLSHRLQISRLLIKIPRLLRL